MIKYTIGIIGFQKIINGIGDALKSRKVWLYLLHNATFFFLLTVVEHFSLNFIKNLKKKIIIFNKIKIDFSKKVLKKEQLWQAQC